VQTRSDSSVFHTPEWLRAIHQTYGYEPVVLTTSPADDRDLRDAAVFCNVKSWLTGNRLVSLPFSDHCGFLSDRTFILNGIESCLQDHLLKRALRYVELRPRQALPVESTGYSTYNFCLHEIDLTIDVDELWHNFHKSCTQRKIRRAQREGLKHVEGRSTELLDIF